MKLLLILITLLFELLPETDTAVIKMELQKKESRKTKYLRKYGEMLLKTRTFQQYRLYRIQSLAESIQNVTNLYDTEYVAVITIGSQKQKFNIIPDTGSSTLWVPSIECLSCIQKMKFNHTASNTFGTMSETLSLQYGDGTSVQGYYGRDTVTLGDGIGLQINKQIFGVATKLGGSMVDGNFDGILGLGFAVLDEYGYDPPLIHAWKANLLDQPIFTIWLTMKAYEANKGGLITYGGYDHEHCDGNITYHNLSSASYWQFQIQSFGAGGYTISKIKEAISDTGTSFIIAPFGTINAIATTLNAYYDQESGYYFINCDTNEPLYIGIGMRTYGIHPANYILDYGIGSGLCILALISMGSNGFGPSFILGDPFIRQYCQIHDIKNEQIGFALSKTTPSVNIAGSCAAGTGTTSFECIKSLAMLIVVFTGLFVDLT